MYDLQVLPQNGFHGNTCQITNMNNYLENRKKREIARVNCINYIVTLILNNNDSSSLF